MNHGGMCTVTSAHNPFKSMNNVPSMASNIGITNCGSNFLSMMNPGGTFSPNVDNVTISNDVA